MSILNVFTAPNFTVESMTVRYFDDLPNPAAEAREGFMDYESVNVKPEDKAGYVAEVVKRIKAHNYRSFSFNEVSSNNRKVTPNKEGYVTMRNVVVMRFPDPIKGKPNRIKHIGIGIAYDVLVLKAE